MKKASVWLGLASLLVAHDIKINQCDIFTNVLQTRDNNSEISMKGDGYIYNSPSCKLYTPEIDQGKWWRRLFCGDKNHLAQAIGKPAKGLNDNEIFINWDINNSEAKVDVGGTKTIQITEKDMILKSNKYRLISQDWNHYPFTWSPTGKSIGVSTFSSIGNNVYLKNIDGKDLKIGKFITSDYGNTNLILSDNEVPSKIEIGLLQVKGSNKFETNLTASDLIDITQMDIGSDEKNTIILKAPTVRIGKNDGINKLYLYNDNNHLIIYADKIYISGLDFKRDYHYGQGNIVEIHPYTPGHKVEAYIGDIVFSSNCKIIMDSGNYYIKNVDTHGSGENVVIMKASDDKQVVNLILYNDVFIKSNVGINTDGLGEENVGNNNPANFRIFIKGNLTTGSGGFGSSTTINGMIYNTKNTYLGTSTVINGTISTYDDIEIGDGSEFYWDKRLGNCSPNGIEYQNKYVCGIFPTPLTSYKSIIVTGSNHRVYDSINIAAQSYQDNLHKLECSINENDNELQNCIRIDPPKNKYNYTLYSNDDNEDYSGSGKTIHLTPNKNYVNRPDIKYMIYGDYKFSGSKTTLIFDEPGDYYFNNLTFTGSNTKVVLPKDGTVRIFVKGDFKSSGSGMRLNENGNPDNLFIYVGRNFDVTGSDTEINGFVYIKGETNLPGSNFKLNGALTSEGNINIKGSRHYYYYHNADALGYGKCPICYDTPRDLSGIKFDIGKCPGMSFSIFSSIAVPIKASDSLKDLTVDELHKKSMFSFDFMTSNEVIDEKGNYVRDANVHNDGLVDVGFLVMDMSLFNNKVITYLLGPKDCEKNNNCEYGPTNEHYQQLKTSSMFNFDFCKWYDSLVYVGHYEENGRHYDVILDKCPTPKNNNHNNEVYTSGPFDAWDVDKDITNRVITTKEVKKGFQLKIASLNADNNATEPKPYLTLGDIKFRLLDTDTNTSLTPWMIIRNPQNPVNIVDIPPISGAHKHVRANFKFCQKDSDDGVIIVPSKYCETNQDGYEYNTSVVSSDDFAIRPDKFVLDIPDDKVKAGDEFNATIKAVDVNGDPVKDYNETVYINTNSLDLEFVISNDECLKGNLQKVDGGEFKDGVANITLKYNEVGDVNFSVKENNGSEFAKTDEDDTSDAQRFITASDEDNVTFIPHHFDVDATLNNFNGGKFTYLSNDLDMASPLIITVTAKNADDETTKNFNAQCFAKDINVSIDETLTPNVNLDKVYRYNGEDNTTDKDDPIVIKHDKANFEVGDNNGSTTLFVYLNFERNASKPVNHFDMTIKEVNISDVDDDVNSSTTDIPGKATFYYGRIETTKTPSNSKKEVDVDFKYDYWNDDKGWILNKDHIDKTFGMVDLDNSYVNGEPLKDSTDIQAANLDATNPVKDGEQKVKFTTNHSLPYGVKIHLAIPSWLWYHPLAKPYKAPSKDNTDCLTHPCVNIAFLSNSAGWGGVSGGNEAIKREFNASKQTVDINKSDDLNATMHDFFKLNW